MIASFVGISWHYRPNRIVRYTIIQAFLLSLRGMARFKKICSEKFLLASVMVHHKR